MFHILDMLIPILSLWGIPVVAGRLPPWAPASSDSATHRGRSAKTTGTSSHPSSSAYGCAPLRLVPKTQVLATRNTATAIAKSEAASDWSVFLYSLPWRQMREETDWELKTHQVFNRWLSEKGFQITCQHSSLLQHSAHCLHYGFWTQRKAKGEVVGSAS